MFSLLPAVLTTLLSLLSVVSAIPTTSDTDRLHAIEPRAPERMCGTDLTPEAIGEREKAFSSLLAKNKDSDRVTDAATNFTVPVNFNIIYASMNVSDGYIPSVTSSILSPFPLTPVICSRDSQVHAQIDVMNQDYNGTGLSFQLQNITRTLNDTWFHNAAPNTDLQADMKKSLRQGDIKTLNIYTVGFTTSSAYGILGFSTFPADYAGNPTDDGVVILYSTLPGGSMTNFSMGRSSTHETGHWLGLYHPFQGGCSEPNDYVDDTPTEGTPASGCPIGRNSCSNRPGSDRK